MLRFAWVLVSAVVGTAVEALGGRSAGAAKRWWRALLLTGGVALAVVLVEMTTGLVARLVWG